MRLFIDADGCPVTRIAVRIAKESGIPCTLLCDTSHTFSIPDVRIITVEKGADSVDFQLVNRIERGDIAITQDYGLAAMCLSKGAFVLHQDGKQYTSENITGLLAFRDVSGKIRRSGGRLKGNPRRTPQQDKAFAAALLELIQRQNPHKPTEGTPI